MKFIIRTANPSDLEDIARLLPRLADFDLPAQRTPEDLWRMDEQLLRDWAAGQEPDCRVFVATLAGDIVGTSIMTFRPEMLSGKPSAHLEALVVSKAAEGIGAGKALVVACEDAARSKGAFTLTLTAFSGNHRARGLYEHLGFDGELLRYTKAL